jgi:hypothetical protein
MSEYGFSSDADSLMSTFSFGGTEAWMQSACGTGTRREKVKLFESGGKAPASAASGEQIEEIPAREEVASLGSIFPYLFTGHPCQKLGRHRPKVGDPVEDESTNAQYSNPRIHGDL